jgi:protein TonB
MTEGIDIRHCHRQRLALFLLLSVAVHATVLLGNSAASMHVDAGTLAEIITVRLDGSDTGARPSAIRPAAQPAAQTHTAAPALVAPTPQSAAIQAARVESPDRSADAQERRVTPPSAEAAARVRARVLADLARHFHYPAIARTRGWQGRVVLAFQINPSGQLQAARVARTSGFAVLDEAALHSLRQVERIADATVWLDDRRLDMQIPVVYQLTDAR